MSKLVHQFVKVLQAIDRPGDFCISGHIDIHTPLLEVTGVGPIALPLLPIQAEQLLKIATPAPYGRGKETIIDPTVRRTWQVDAQQVHISGRHWQHDLNHIVNQVTNGLGITGKVIAEPYKLLIYNSGSFFITHRDTEKAPGMFATLVLVLPCNYQGGTLRIEHKGREERIDLHPTDPSELAFAAFYADCRHEVLPISDGYRIALIYNLLRQGKEPIPQPPDYTTQREQIENLLRAWTQASILNLNNATNQYEDIDEDDYEDIDEDYDEYADEDEDEDEDEDNNAKVTKHSNTSINDDADTDNDIWPVKLVFPLEHAYTQAELDFRTLKGADIAIASLLNKACTVTNCDCYLALLTMWESGYAEYSGYHGDDFEIGEVTDFEYTLEHLRHPDGNQLNVEKLKFSKKEVCPPDALKDFTDTKPEFEEATGNEGASFERTYQRAALVIWPRANRGRIIAGDGLKVSLPFLTALVQRWEQQGRIKNSQYYQEAIQLAHQIRQRWPVRKDSWEYQRSDRDGHAHNLLDLLERLDDLTQSANFVAEQVIVGKAYNAADNTALAKLLRQIPLNQTTDLLRNLLTNLGSDSTVACAQLLCLCTESPAIANAALQPAALTLIKVLPRTPPPPRTNVITPELVTHTLTALERIDATLAQTAMRVFLEYPQVYAVEEILVTAALALHQQQHATTLPASFAELRRFALSFLNQSINALLAPPADWRRECNIKCDCKHCTNLKQFLADPKTAAWELRAAEKDRKHVEEKIRLYPCDLDLVTNRQGRPYGLICKKNQDCYQRQLRKRERHLQLLAQLQN